MSKVLGNNRRGTRRSACFGSDSVITDAVEKNCSAYDLMSIHDGSSLGIMSPGWPAVPRLISNHVKLPPASYKPVVVTAVRQFAGLHASLYPVISKL